MWEFRIDTGGTFTDCLGRSPTGQWYRVKVLSNGSMRARVREVAEGDRIRISIRRKCPDGFFKGFSLEAPGLDHGYVVENYDSRRGEIVLRKPLARQLQPGELLILQFPGEAPELGARLLTATGGDASLPPARLRLATTRGTNALLEGKGASTVLFINRGLADLLTINTQQRPDLFALEIKRPGPCTDESSRWTWMMSAVSSRSRNSGIK